MSALLVGALAFGNPFLPPRTGARNAPVRAGDGTSTGGAALARREGRAIAPFAVRAAWQESRALPRRSPAWALQRQHLVLPRDVGQAGGAQAASNAAAVVPASFVAPVPDDGSRPPQ